MLFKKNLIFSDILNMKKNILIILFLVCNCLLFSEVYKTNVTVSYYAGDFHGKKTSNGEYFNMNAFTCAHKSLPFNTVLKVTNLSNGKSVEVRVNDRGPFVAGREVDLSKAAASQIGMIKSGTCRAKIEIVKMGKNTKLSQQTADSAKKIMEKLYGKRESYDPSLFYDIQIASFSTKEAASKTAQKLLKAGFKDVVYQKTSSAVRVTIKKVPGQKVPETEKKLQEKGFTNYLVKVRKN